MRLLQLCEALDFYQQRRATEVCQRDLDRRGPREVTRETFLDERAIFAPAMIDAEVSESPEKAVPLFHAGCSLPRATLCSGDKRGQVHEGFGCLRFKVVVMPAVFATNTGGTPHQEP